MYRDPLTGPIAILITEDTVSMTTSMLASHCVDRFQVFNISVKDQNGF